LTKASIRARDERSFSGEIEWTHLHGMPLWLGCPFGWNERDRNLGILPPEPN